jgi:hypothetical protein
MASADEDRLGPIVDVDYDTQLLRIAAAGRRNGGRHPQRRSGHGQRRGRGRGRERERRRRKRGAVRGEESEEERRNVSEASLHGTTEWSGAFHSG